MHKQMPFYLFIFCDWCRKFKDYPGGVSLFSPFFTSCEPYYTADKLYKNDDNKGQSHTNSICTKHHYLYDNVHNVVRDHKSLGFRLHGYGGRRVNCIVGCIAGYGNYLSIPTNEILRIAVIG